MGNVSGVDVSRKAVWLAALGMRATGRALVCFLVSAGAMAQTPDRPWQHLQSPTVAAVRAGWVTPPSEYGPEPYYGLNGPVTLHTVEHDLDTMQALGFRAVTMQYGYGSDRPYLSDAYLSFFRDVVQAVKRHNMRLWIVDDAGYPSGFAGGRFSSEHPELRMQALVAGSAVKVETGSVLDEAVPADAVAVTALDASQKAIQIPFAGGRLHWAVPAGNWTVYMVEHAFRTSPTRSDTNLHRVKDTSQSLEDYLDPAATAQFLRFTHEAYRKFVGEEFGRTILGFRGDEPDYSLSGLPWTPQFFDRFQREKGYDIRPYVATFLQPKGVALSEADLRARADYYDVFADMFRDGFFRPQGDWCAANGLEYQVHLNHEEQEVALAHSEGDFFRDMRYVQVPGIDAIWHQIWTDTVSDYPRLASSAAHVYGHPRSFTESFAAYRPLPDLAMARYILNEQMVRGINLVETMYFPSSSSPHGGGPMAFMRDPGYPALMQYVSRMSYVLSMGRPAANVALLLPAESLWVGDTTADDTFVSTERLLSEHQVDFDIVGEDAVRSDMTLHEGAFVNASGQQYHTVLIPHASLLPMAVLDRLRAFARGGGQVVFLGGTPTYLGAQSDLFGQAATPADFAWATVLHGDLPATPIPPAQPPASAPLPMVVSQQMIFQLTQHLPPPEFSLPSPVSALRYTHRVLWDGTVYLFFNESATALHTTVALHTKRLHAEQWDARTGAAVPVPAEAPHSQGALRLPLNLEPYATELLVVR